MKRIVIAAIMVGFGVLPSVALAERATEYVYGDGSSESEARANAIAYAKNLYNHHTVKGISFGQCSYTRPYNNEHRRCKLPVHVERHD